MKAPRLLGNLGVCRRWESNPHPRDEDCALNAARLPIPPLRLGVSHFNLERRSVKSGIAANGSRTPSTEANPRRSRGIAVALCVGEGFETLPYGDHRSGMVVNRRQTPNPPEERSTPTGRGSFTGQKITAEAQRAQRFFIDLLCVLCVSAVRAYRPHRRCTPPTGARARFARLHRIRSAVCGAAVAGMGETMDETGHYPDILGPLS